MLRTLSQHYRCIKTCCVVNIAFLRCCTLSESIYKTFLKVLLMSCAINVILKPHLKHLHNVWKKKTTQNTIQTHQTQHFFLDLKNMCSTCVDTVFKAQHYFEHNKNIVFCICCVRFVLY